MKNRIIVYIILLLIAALGILSIGLLTGPAKLSMSQVWDGILGNNLQAETIVLGLRMPRILMALLTGAILTLGGFFMQALVRNPLADPYILGVSSGAGLGVNLLILGFIPIAGITALTYPIAAFAGGLASLTFLFFLAGKHSSGDTSKLLISGIAVSSLCTALTGLLIYLFADSNQVRRFLFWTFGDFSHCGYEGVLPSLIVLLIAWAIRSATALDVLQFGHKEAKSLGLDTKRIQIILILLTTLITGTAIGFTGPVGFVGLMIPHFSRAALGDLHRKNLILAPLAGGVYLAACDLLSQWLYPPVGLPIGIVTALLGIPFFLFLVRKK